MHFLRLIKKGQKILIFRIPQRRRTLDWKLQKAVAAALRSSAIRNGITYQIFSISLNFRKKIKFSSFELGSNPSVLSSWYPSQVYWFFSVKKVSFLLLQEKFLEVLLHEMLRFLLELMKKICFVSTFFLLSPV